MLTVRLNIINNFSVDMKEPGRRILFKFLQYKSVSGCNVNDIILYIFDSVFAGMFVITHDFRHFFFCLAVIMLSL